MSATTSSQIFQIFCDAGLQGSGRLGRADDVEARQ
jgi:hypothetical protein